VEGLALAHEHLKAEIQLQVENLHARYAHALDADRLEDWPNFFTENGTYRIATAENEARGLPLPILMAEGRAMMRDRVASLRHANIYEPQRYRHIVSSVLLERISDRQVGSIASFLVIRIMENGDTMLFASGQYRDRILLSGDPGEPQYEERVVICDSRRFDTLLAIPL
jgi:anthranilate 1,2-dioxygenase small subunit